MNQKPSPECLSGFPDDILARAKNIKLLTCDVDGVLTDGRIYFNDEGVEVVDGVHRLVGALHLHDLFRARIL